MTVKFEADVLKQYVQAFGAEKMQRLFAEFRHLSAADMAQFEGWISKGDRKSLRFCFHRLRSSAQIFGMSGFAALCAELEDAVLSGSLLTTLDFKIAEAKIIYNEELLQAEAGLKAGMND